jgi:hypothetical protein
VEEVGRGVSAFRPGDDCRQGGHRVLEGASPNRSCL